MIALTSGDRRESQLLFLGISAEGSSWLCSGLEAALRLLAGKGRESLELRGPSFPLVQPQKQPS